mmetsp:Transcript_35907/g.57749  ORF Transcript_35907/g.57749 Transcript_35907/m.57749 type:complete len:112 (+) Transcript_35907:446-781(+)
MKTVELRLLALAGGLTVAAYRKFDGPTKKQVSEDAELNAVWTSLLSCKGQDANFGGNTIRMKHVSPEGIVRNQDGTYTTRTFNQVAAAVAKRGEVLIGWKLDRQVSINPSA